MKLRLLILLLFTATVSAMAQPAQGPVVYQNYTATGTCSLPNFLTVVTSGAGAGVYQCKGSPLTWQSVGSTGFVTSLTTNGTSGPATATSGILNIPNYALGGGGLSGQTINCVPLAASATTSTASSTVCQRAGGQIVVGSATNVAPSQDPTFEVRRIVGGAISHGVSVDDVLSGGINPYAAFDSRLEITGGFNIDHYAGYQDIPTVDVGYTGTLTNLINFVGYANINGGTVTNRFGYEVNDVILSGSGSVGTQYGIYVNPLTHAGVNHGIYVPGTTDDNFFGGPTVITNLTVGSCTGCAAGVGAPSGMVEDWIAQEGQGTTLVNSGYNFTDNATATNVTWGTATGFPGKVATFNGTTSFAFATNLTATNFDGSTPFSGCVWIYPTAVVGTGLHTKLMSTVDNAASPFPGWDFNLAGSGTAMFLQLLLINNISTNLINTGNTTISVTVNTLHHACFTYDGSKLASGTAIYLDGAALAMTTFADTLTGSIASPVTLALGSNHNGAGATGFYQGALGQAPVFNRLLSASDVSALFAHGPRPY